MSVVASGILAVCVEPLLPGASASHLLQSPFLFFEGFPFLFFQELPFVVPALTHRFSGCTAMSGDFGCTLSHDMGFRLILLLRPARLGVGGCGHGYADHYCLSTFGLLYRTLDIICPCLGSGCRAFVAWLPCSCRLAGLLPSLLSYIGEVNGGQRIPAVADGFHRCPCLNRIAVFSDTCSIDLVFGRSHTCRFS